jgi:hypothetical protein
MPEDERKDYLQEKETAVLFNDILRITSVSVEVYQHDPIAAASIRFIVQAIQNMRETDWGKARLERQQKVDRVLSGMPANNDLELEAHRLKVLKIVYDANIEMQGIRKKAVWHLSFHPFDIFEKTDKRYGDIATSLLRGDDLRDIEEQCSVNSIEDYVAGRER